MTRLLDPDCVYFPDPGEIRPHAIAFARMMFAHGAFEREVRELQSDIAKEHGFGERRVNQWRTRERAERMVALIEEKLGKDLPETASIEKFLAAAVAPCEQRNLLAHGTWWCFDRGTSSIQVRSGIRWDGDEFAPCSWSIWRRRIGESPIRWRRSHRRRRPQKFSATPNKEIPFGNCCAGAVNRGFSTFSTEADKEPAAF